MWAPAQGDMHWICTVKCVSDDVAALVLPTPSLKSARQRAKFENLSEGEKVEKLRLLLIQEGATNNYTGIARAALAVMEGRTL